MSDFPFELEVDEEDIRELPLIPSGDVLLCEVADVPEVNVSERTGTTYVSLRFVVIEDESEFKGESVFGIQSLPDPLMKARCYVKRGLDKNLSKEEIEELTKSGAAEYEGKKPKDIPTSTGYRIVCDTYNTFCDLFDLSKTRPDFESIVGAQIKAKIDNRREGDKSNRAQALLPA